MSKEFYKNYPEEFYLINDLLSRLIAQAGLEKNVKVLVTTFDFVNRCVNYYAISDDMKRFEDGKITNRIKYFLNNEGSNYLKAYIKDHFFHDRFKETRDYFENKLWNRTSEEEFHYHLTELYHFFPINPEKHIDGVLKSHGWKNPRTKYACIDSNSPFYPWLKLTTFDDKQIFSYVSQTTLESSEQEPQTTEAPTWKPKLFWEYIYNLFTDPDFKPENFESPPLKNHFFIAVPVFDAGIPYEHSGNLLCHIYLFFSEDNETRDSYPKDKITEIWSKWGPHIAEIAFAARRQELISQPIKDTDDILKDLLQKIAFIQDWERVIVLSKPDDDNPQYCFKRFSRQKLEKIWDICENDNNCEDCKELLKDLKSALQQKKDVSCAGKNIFVKRVADILDPKILPSIEDAEILRYKNYVLCFEFPKDTSFPIEKSQDKEAAVKILGEHYINKLITVFDRLLLKAKVLKNSIRSAVSAIIGRNMSHNIGSHVLSYGPASLKTTETKLSQVRFYEYLRQRMDFIAEICTADPSWYSSMNLIRDILIPFFRQEMLLNFIALSEGVHRDVCEENDCSKNHHNICFKVLIGGKICFDAKSVQFHPDPEFSYRLNDEEQFTPEKCFFRERDPEPLIIKHDIPVSMPHGIIGCHAFYSILENFIRNSAKHGQNRLNKRKDFEIIFSIDGENPDLVKLNIADNIGNCDYLLKKKLSSGLNPSKEPLVDNEGRLNSGNLGLKEMRVCANFLRMRPTNQADIKTPYQALWSDDALKKSLIELDCDKKICSGDHPCEKPNLQYALYLFKPKEALVVCTGQLIKKMRKNELDRFQNQGIYFQDIDTFKTSCEKSFSHRFLAVQNDLFDDLMNHIKSGEYQLPLRVVPVDAPDNISVEYLYKNWIKGIDPKHDNLKIVWRGAHSGGIDDIFCTKTKQIPEETNILFDNHGESNREGKGCIYYQPYRGDERVYRLLYTIAGDKESQKLRYYEVIEASVTNVIIADERIWKKTAGEMNFGPQLTRTKRAVLNDMRIRLIPLENNRVSIKSIKQFLARTEKGIPCFFIMHQGIIDKMNNKEQNDLNKIVTDYQKRLDHFTYIVTSGRGIPDFSHREKFIEISNLEAFIEERDKYGLVQTLFSLRRPQNG